MKFLVASDLHLSDRIWLHRPIEGDSYHSWDQITYLAIEHKVDGVILAGDVLDKQQNLSNPIHQLFVGLNFLTACKIPVYYNQGQHEYQASPWLATRDNTYWLNSKTITTPTGWRIAGCDYQSAENLQKFLTSDVALSADVLVCHQVWKDFMGEVGKPQGEFADIPSNVRILITGDYHEHICQQFGNLTVLSPGSTHMRSISEPEDHEVFLLELGDRAEKPKIRNLPLFTRRCYRFDSRGFSNFGELKLHVDTMLKASVTYATEHELPESLHKPLLQLTHLPSEDELVRQFISTFADKGHLFFKPVTIKDNDSEDLLDYLDPSDRVNLNSCLDQFISEKEQPAAYSLAVAMLQSPDPEQVLARWVQENA